MESSRFRRILLFMILCFLSTAVASGADKPAGVVVPLSLTDPTPHFEEAWRDRFLDEPRYDIPPRGFNEHSFFDDALVDFDAIRGWTAEMRDCEGVFCLSNDMPIRGKPNAKVEVKLTGKKPYIALKPPKPIRIAHAFDTVDMWFYGHKLAPMVGYVFRKKDGALYRWKGGSRKDVVPGWTTFWNRLRIRFPEVIEAGAELVAVEIYPKPWTKTDLSLIAPPEQDHLFYVDQFRVSLFADMMKRPAPTFPNRGPVVKIPVDENGACPRTVDALTTRVSLAKGVSRLTYVTKSGEEATYVYKPETGTLDDLTVEFKGRQPFRPAVDSGPVFEFGGKTCSVVGKDKGGATAKLLSHRIEGDTVVAEWLYSGNGASQTVRYAFSLRGKTLQVQLNSNETWFSEWKFGYADGLKNYKAVDVPFMLVWSPRLLVNDGLFVTYNADWYESNVSTLPHARPLRPLPEGCAQYSFSDPEYDKFPWKYAYLPRTDGSRHPLKERFYITVSSNVDEVWLSVSNPPSPNKSVLKKYLYRMMAPEGDYVKKTNDVLDLYEKYGMTDIYWMYHSRLWIKRRMGCDPVFGSDTVSLVHQPYGGDDGLIKLFQRMRDMGMRTGYYDGYESMSTANKWFRGDWCKYESDGNWRMRWGAVMKPWALAEYASTVYRDRAKKFGAQVLYQDGWTSKTVSLWNDYDHRYPESGKFIDTLRALGTGWQRCRESCNGPVFSEGRGGDYYTAGLDDGDYSKLMGSGDNKGAAEDRDELLVDFCLKKVAPLSPSVTLSCGFVAWAKPQEAKIRSWRDWSLYHHFMAAQFAFGTICTVEPTYVIRPPHMDFDVALRGYYLCRQLQERYIMEPVEDIRYFDGERLVTSSEAIVRGVCKENRLRIRYANGLVMHINMNWDGKHWLVEDGGRTYDLPPGGWLARQGDDFLEFAVTRNGTRVDFVDSPEYVYLDGHGTPVTVNGYTATNQFVKLKTGPRAGTELVYPEK